MKKVYKVLYSDSLIKQWILLEVYDNDIQELCNDVFEVWYKDNTGSIKRFWMSSLYLRSPYTVMNTFDTSKEARAWLLMIMLEEELNTWIGDVFINGFKKIKLLEEPF